ncbi:MAG: PAS domain-containing protein, partial [Planctomycetota bacterium]
MARNRAELDGRFPMRFLTAAVILTGVALAWFGWDRYQSYRDERDARERDFEIAQLRGRIIHLGEVLTMSARMAAVTGEPEWEQRYHDPDHERKLKDAVGEIISVVLRKYDKELIEQIEDANGSPPKMDSESLELARLMKLTDQLEDANDRLLEMENEALELASQGEKGREGAQSKLASADHRTQRRIRARVLLQLGVARHPELRLEELRGTIVHLDEVLTMSARLAAATGDVRWENRYRDFHEPRLEDAIDAAIDAARRTAPDPSAGEEAARAAAQTDAANKKLVAMEYQAFGLVREGRLQDARDRLNSEEYKREKRKYAKGMAAFADCLSKAAETARESEQKKALLRVSLAGVVIAVLLAGWLVVLRNMFNWRAVLSTRNRELAQQASELEMRVQRRTVQLTSTNEELGREITERRRAETAIRDSEALYSSLVESLPIHVLRKDLDGRFTYANRSFCDLIGKRLEEIVGKTDFDFYPAELAEKYRRNDR